MNLRRYISDYRRLAAERFGIGRYSYLGLNGLDRHIEQYIDKDNGFFIEAGANDGFRQSNTYYFEKMRGWRGILIEPIPELSEKCRRLRRHSHVVNAALVAEDYPASTIAITYADLMSTSSGSFNRDATAAHLEHAQKVQNLQQCYEIEVPARTLTSILDEFSVNCPIDLLSLDVEGAEAQALRGLNLQRYLPRYLCVEVRDRTAIDFALGNSYTEEAVLYSGDSYQDVLFRHRE